MSCSPYGVINDASIFFPSFSFSCDASYGFQFCIFFPLNIAYPCNPVKSSRSFWYSSNQTGALKNVQFLHSKQDINFFAQHDRSSLDALHRPKRGSCNRKRRHVNLKVSKKPQLRNDNTKSCTTIVTYCCCCNSSLNTTVHNRQAIRGCYTTGEIVRLYLTDSDSSVSSTTTGTNDAPCTGDIT